MISKLVSEFHYSSKDEKYLILGFTTAFDHLFVVVLELSPT